MTMVKVGGQKVLLKENSFVFTGSLHSFVYITMTRFGYYKKMIASFIFKINFMHYVGLLIIFRCTYMF